MRLYWGSPARLLSSILFHIPYDNPGTPANYLEKKSPPVHRLG